MGNIKEKNMILKNKNLLVKKISKDRTLIGWLLEVKGEFYGDYITYVGDFDKEARSKNLDFFNSNLKYGLFGKKYRPKLKDKEEFLAIFK